MVHDVVAVVDYGTFSCATRPLKGGSWATGMAELKDATKDLCPLYRTDTVGFRCCRQRRGRRPTGPERSVGVLGAARQP